MGITRRIEEYERDVLDFMGWEYRGLTWCELGNMRHKRLKVAAKKIYEKYGVRHTSIDLNGRDGALLIDLGQSVPHVFINQFDVVTNYGTVEHINNQFQVFKNIHDMCKVGGIMIHAFPLLENWPDHARYYYSRGFAQEMANICSYHAIKQIVLDEKYYKKPRNLTVVTFIKEERSRFVTEEGFNRIDGIVDSGDLRRTGDYATRERTNG